MGGAIASNGNYLEELLPKAAQLWLYRWALDRGHLDTILDRFVVQPLIWLSNVFARIDTLGLHQPASRREKVVLSLQTPASQGRD
jgi:hypothetical protein